MHEGHALLRHYAIPRTSPLYDALSRAFTEPSYQRLRREFLQARIPAAVRHPLLLDVAYCGMT